MARGSILLLEDDEGLAFLVRKSLERIGFVVTWLSDSNVRLSSSSFDLAILDFRLQGNVTGLDFYKSLVADGRKIPAILITGFTDEEVLLEALRLGVRDFLPKNQAFLNLLPVLVERVMEEVVQDRRLVQAEREQHAQSQVIEALRAVQIGYWSLKFQPHEVIWPMDIYPTVFLTNTNIRHFIRGFLRSISSTERPTVLSELKRARKSRSNFEISFQEAIGKKWFRIKGSFEYRDADQAMPVRAVGMIWEETEERESEIMLSRSLAELGMVTEKLKVSMMEIHHRVKNSFQVVRSLLNMEFRKHGSLDQQGVAKIIAYIQGLASIHDILTDNIKSNDSLNDVQVCNLIDKLVHLIKASDEKQSVDIDCDNDFHVSSRIASSLAVIMSELLMNALKYGTGEIKLTVRPLSFDRCALSIRNDVGSSPTEKNGRNGTGFSLIDFLVRTDFRGTFKSHTHENGSFTAELDFPIIAQNPS